NFSPRDIEGFGLCWDEVHLINGRAVMVRMQAFGLSGPWRNRTGFAQTMEQVSGMAWVTGWPDGPPLLPRGACDPMAGMHAVVALLAGLDRARETGEGELVEMTMVEAALNAAAEQIVEYSAYGTLLGRRGNRGPGASPQGLYACRGEENWLAVSVATDEHWKALRQVIGGEAWETDPATDTASGRKALHDRLDEKIAAWCGALDLDEAVETLAAVGVPCAAVVAPVDIGANPQLAARGLIEEVDHPVVGRHGIPGIPFHFVGREQPWLRRPPPTLGQHNNEVLGELMTRPELDELRAKGIVGERLLGF
ncbi:MAG: CaiB/BaiF CoA transferase family protein, partial [Acidimicrobiales bacterium]